MDDVTPSEGAAPHSPPLSVMRRNADSALIFTRAVAAVVKTPSMCIIAHSCVSLIFLICAQIITFMMRQLEYAGENIMGTDYTVGDLVNFFEAIWLIIILGTGLLKGTKRLWEE